MVYNRRALASQYNNFLFSSHRKTSCDMDPANCYVARDDVCIVFVGNNYTAPHNLKKKPQLHVKQ